MPFFIPDHYMFFPHPLLADEDGFLAMCDDLSPDRILMAYHFGIFPWHMQGQPMWWFYTHPRCIMIPNQIKVSKSMRSYFNQNKFTVTFDTCFSDVINACGTIKRKDQDGTWIIPEIKSAFNYLHSKGIAHSVEVWEDGKLVGGLYGIALGKIFFGESMFAKVSNASKFGFITLCRFLEQKGFELIDCQQITTHMMRLGASVLSKEDFYNEIRKNQLKKTVEKKWVI